MIETLREAELKFLDLQPVVKTEKFTTDDYTAAVVDDIGSFLGVSDGGALQRRLYQVFEENMGCAGTAR